MAEFEIGDRVRVTLDAIVTEVRPNNAIRYEVEIDDVLHVMGDTVLFDAFEDELHAP